MIPLLRLVFRIWTAVRRRGVSLLGRWVLRAAAVSFGEGLTLYGIPIVRSSGDFSIRLGKNVVLCSEASATALGVNHPVVFETGAPGATIVIGDHVGISGASICAWTRIEIGSHCLLGANVMVVDTDFHSIDPVNRRYSRENVKSAPVIIEENVFLGANTVVLKGVRIGRNSVIGAGSVVTRDIPPDTLAAGNPCRPLSALPSSVTA